jgi:drug/metabolite transporter (DMT)-like permease
VSLPLNAVATVLYMQAIRSAPLSLSVPYLAFTPVFMIGTGYLVLGELPNVWGLWGIAGVFVGSYVLNLDPSRFRPLAPLQAVVDQPGARLMLLVALLFSFAAVIGKKAILASSPLFFTVSFFACMNVCVVLGLLLAGKIRMRQLLGEPVKGAVVGLLLCAHALLHAHAVALVEAAYMIAVKRLSILFEIVFGRLLF